jgi:hypothetical protein
VEYGIISRDAGVGDYDVDGLVWRVLFRSFEYCELFCPDPDVAFEEVVAAATRC